MNYRRKNDLKRELGQAVSEDIKSLCSFIRSEATTLELAAGTDKSTKKVNYMRTTNDDHKTPDNDTNKNENEKTKCHLGCDTKHRLVDCEEYMKKNVDDRVEVLRSLGRCFTCLGVGHASHNCCKKDDNNWKCRVCSKTNHHWTVCSSTKINAAANDFCTVVDPSSNDLESIACECQSVNTIRHKKDKDYPPVVIAEVEMTDGTWRKAKCLLDNGSNWSLVRTDFARSNELEDIGPSNNSFGVAGGGVHNEEGVVHDFNIKIRGRGRTDVYVISATGMKKPCFDVPCIPSKTFIENPHLQEEKSSVYVDGGEIDILVGSDYGPLITSEGNTRAPFNPDEHPSMAHTRLGNYIYGGMSPHTKYVDHQQIQLNYINAVEEHHLNKFFYTDILGVKPTSTCVCSDKEIAESAFINKHAKLTTHINDEGRVVIRGIIPEENEENDQLVE